MKTIRLMHAKLHRVTVTSANVNYIGSITIDPDLMDEVGILPLEEVDIINLNNAKRWSTYAIPGKKGSGEICPNGGAPSFPPPPPPPPPSLLSPFLLFYFPPFLFLLVTFFFFSFFFS